MAVRPHQHRSIERDAIERTEIRMLKVFDPLIKGETDRFAYRFTKP